MNMICDQFIFLPLLAGGHFQVYLTARAQNVFPRIFALLTYQNSNAQFNLQSLLVLGLELSNRLHPPIALKKCLFQSIKFTHIRAGESVRF